MLLFLLCAQLAGSPAAVDSTYSTPALRTLVARAAEANRAPPPDFRSYQSHIETELSLLLRDTLGREHTGQIEQLATTGVWTRSGRYDLHVVGYRSQTIGVPYSALSIVRAWTVPSLYGNRLSMGAYFNPRGPTYSARGRMSRLCAYCSRTCAVQPDIRLQAKIGVKRSVGIPKA